jgi:hypothetical protein
VTVLLWPADNTNFTAFHHQMMIWWGYIDTAMLYLHIIAGLNRIELTTAVQNLREKA